jgi:hypothetical protein
MTHRLKIENSRWGWHFRLWLSNRWHAAYCKRFGWHIKAGRFVRARTTRTK